MSIEKKQRKGGRIDLHLHSRNSDGENSVEELIRMAAEAGFCVIAITDHNTFSLSSPVLEGGLTVIPGCEFSVSYLDPSRNETVEIHITGIFPDGVHPEDFSEIFRNIRDGKRDYVRAILQKLESIGIRIPYEEVEEAGRKAGRMGRHQIADVMTARGYVRDTGEAFDRYIGNFCPYYVPSTRYVKYAPLETVVRRIRASGGLPVLAHPFDYSMDEAEMERLISDFRSAAGAAAGMEVYYEKYLTDPGKTAFLEKMAERCGLLALAASDRHRKEQPFASAGTEEMYEALLLALHG